MQGYATCSKSDLAQGVLKTRIIADQIKVRIYSHYREERIATLNCLIQRGERRLSSSECGKAACDDVPRNRLDLIRLEHLIQHP